MFLAADVSAEPRNAPVLRLRAAVITSTAKRPTAAALPMPASIMSAVARVVRLVKTALASRLRIVLAIRHRADVTIPTAKRPTVAALPMLAPSMSAVVRKVRPAKTEVVQMRR